MFNINKYKHEIIELLQTISLLKEDVSNLRETIDIVANLATEAFSKSESAVVLYKEIGIDKNNPLWFETCNSYDNLDKDTQMLALGIIKSAKKDYAKKNPTLKKHIIFHGGCNSCELPEKEGLKVCFGCGYFDWNSTKPFLNK